MTPELVDHIFSDFFWTVVGLFVIACFFGVFDK